MLPVANVLLFHYHSIHFSRFLYSSLEYFSVFLCVQYLIWVAVGRREEVLTEASRTVKLTSMEQTPGTVEPQNKGHFGANSFVSCREVVPISEVK